ncbi:NACHT C-terminal helical domain 2-containing protein, partial [Microcoleus sp. herbarium2]|uniref:NACHT C-terminal helical domain 2-containing protein n=1 Tax=Microcoleus sp. herbarium2 TaxID=3055433 RepID=UPI002FD14AB0
GCNPDSVYLLGLFVTPPARELRQIIISYRNIGHDWQFSAQQKSLLRKYYDANKLLVDCLNSGCNVSPAVRQEIEETLLLPIANIQKIGDKCVKRSYPVGNRPL